ncbi:MAG: hypothetical protein HW380_20 [Magnetococcales bacterium]|nr:hypothetical protein [Magnetococcales bacterium]
MAVVVFNGGWDGQTCVDEFVQKGHGEGQGLGFFRVFHQGEDELSLGGCQAKVAVDDALGDAVQVQGLAERTAVGEQFKVGQMDGGVNRHGSLHGEGG